MGNTDVFGGGASTERKKKRESLLSATTYLRRHVESKVHVEYSGSSYFVWESENYFQTAFIFNMFHAYFCPQKTLYLYCIVV